VTLNNVENDLIFILLGLIPRGKPRGIELKSYFKTAIYKIKSHITLNRTLH